MQLVTESRPTVVPTPTPIEALFQEHGRAVFRTAFRVTGSESDAEDVTQSVFLRLMANQHVPRLRDEPGPYLRRAATNAALDMLRRRKTSRAVPLEPESGRLADAGAGPERELAGRALHARLREAIAGLSPRAAEVITLRFIEGLSNGEIAEVLETSTAVVAVTLHRARRDLRRAMQDVLGDERPPQ